MKEAPTPLPLPSSIDGAVDLLASGDYIADRSLGTVLFLALRMGRPLFLEGEAGVGKTEIAKVLAGQLGRKLIRLQCYEGLDAASAVYEWNYPAQMIEIRAAEAAGDADRETLVADVFAERFLVRRPLLQALDPDPAGPPVLAGPVGAAGYEPPISPLIAIPPIPPIPSPPPIPISGLTGVWNEAGFLSTNVGKSGAAIGAAASG